MRGSIADFLFSVRPQIVFGGGGDGGGGGGGGGGSDNDGGGRSEAEIQKDINAALDASGGAWTSELNDLVSERDEARANPPAAATSNNTSPATSNNDTDNESGGGGYTSFIDMFDGGGAGGSGSEFYSGSHEDYLKTDAGITDTQTDAAGLTNYSGGTYTGIKDMFDGGGPGQSGDTFQGPLSDVGNFATSGGIIGSVIQGLTGGGNQDTALTEQEQILVDTYGWTDNGDGTLTSPTGERTDFQNQATGAAAATAAAEAATGAPADSGSGGYTSITDMFDGGGPGQSGDTFGGALGGISNALGATPYGSGIAPTGVAGAVNDAVIAATDYTSVGDMFDGGGPGASGDDFGGALGGISNAIGAEPIGSSEDPSGIAGLIGGGIVGGVNTVGGMFDGGGPDGATTTAPVSTTPVDVGGPADTTDTGTTIVPPPPPPVTPTEQDQINALRLGVIQAPTYAGYNSVTGGVSTPGAGYTPSGFIQDMQDYYTNVAAQNYGTSPFTQASYVPPNPAQLSPMRTNPAQITTMMVGEEDNLGTIPDQINDLKGGNLVAPTKPTFV